MSPEDRAVVVEDVITTGGSTRETMDVAVAAGAAVVAAASIIDRGTQPARLDVPLFSLVRLDVPVYEPDKCPMCARGEPVVKPGSRT
ncbi:MAG: orotate phosphoribosyltransferase, partial [Acidobacteria bacterium]|nr:orotate phosphoribosyltransferase [Acidobacteriota bacterium]